MLCKGELSVINCLNLLIFLDLFNACQYVSKHLQYVLKGNVNLQIVK